MSKYTPSETEMPKDPNNVTSGRSVAYNESAQRPSDPNMVTGNKARHSGESDNRPAKPENA